MIIAVVCNVGIVDIVGSVDNVVDNDDIVENVGSGGLDAIIVVVDNVEIVDIVGIVGLVDNVVDTEGVELGIVDEEAGVDVIVSTVEPKEKKCLFGFFKLKHTHWPKLAKNCLIVFFTKAYVESYIQPST